MATIKRIAPLAAATLAAVATSAPAAHRPRCIETTCSVSLEVRSAKPVRWTSPQRFRSTDALSVKVFVNGHRLTYVESVGECASRFYGRGTVVATKACGRLSALHVSAHHIFDKPATVRVRYELVGEPAPNTDAQR